MTHDTNFLYFYVQTKENIAQTQVSADSSKLDTFTVIASLNFYQDTQTGYSLYTAGFYPSSDGYDAEIRLHFANGTFQYGVVVNQAATDANQQQQVKAAIQNGHVVLAQGSNDFRVAFAYWQIDPESSSPIISAMPPTYPEIKQCPDGPYAFPNGTGAACFGLDENALSPITPTRPTGPFVYNHNQAYLGAIAFAINGTQIEIRVPFTAFLEDPSNNPHIALGTSLAVSFTCVSSGGSLSIPVDTPSSDSTVAVQYKLDWPTFISTPQGIVIVVVCILFGVGIIISLTLIFFKYKRRKRVVYEPITSE